MKSYSIKTSQYFPKPYKPFGGDINVEVDLEQCDKSRYQRYFTCWYFKFFTKIKSR